MNYPLKKIKTLFQTLLRFFTRAKQWDILFIDNHGKVLPFQYVRGFFILLTTLALLLLMFTVYLYILKVRTLDQNKDLQECVTFSRNQINSLQKEIDELMVLLADAQSKIPDVPSTKSSKPKSATPPKPAEVKKAPPVKSTENPTVMTKESTSEQKPAAIVDKQPLPVVSDFLAYFDAVSETLNARFDVKNASGGTRLSGYAFVIMKGPQDNADSWLTIPHQKTTSGIPADFKAGKLFNIRNFMTLNLAMDNIKGPKSFDKATVFIFSPEGKQIFAKTYRTKINISAPPVPPVISKPETKTETTAETTFPAVQEASPPQQLNRDNPQEEVPTEDPETVNSKQ